MLRCALRAGLEHPPTKHDTATGTCAAALRLGQKTPGPSTAGTAQPTLAEAPAPQTADAAASQPATVGSEASSAAPAAVVKKSAAVLVNGEAEKLQARVAALEEELRTLPTGAGGRSAKHMRAKRAQAARRREIVRDLGGLRALVKAEAAAVRPAQGVRNIRTTAEAPPAPALEARAAAGSDEATPVVDAGGSLPSALAPSTATSSAGAAGASDPRRFPSGAAPPQRQPRRTGPDQGSGVEVHEGDGKKRGARSRAGKRGKRAPA